MRLQFNQRNESERRIIAVPRWILVLFVAAFVAYAALRATAPKPVAIASALEAPLPEHTLRALSLGEPQAMSQFLTLYLQAFDNQPGISIPFSALDYERVMAWLKTALTLDPASQYPLNNAWNSCRYRMAASASSKSSVSWARVR